MSRPHFFTGFVSQLGEESSHHRERSGEGDFPVLSDPGLRKLLCSLLSLTPQQRLGSSLCWGCAHLLPSISLLVVLCRTVLQSTHVECECPTPCPLMSFLPLFSGPTLFFLLPILYDSRWVFLESSHYQPPCSLYPLLLLLPSGATQNTQILKTTPTMRIMSMLLRATANVLWLLFCTRNPACMISLSPQSSPTEQGLLFSPFQKQRN